MNLFPVYSSKGGAYKDKFSPLFLGRGTGRRTKRTDNEIARNMRGERRKQRPETILPIGVEQLAGSLQRDDPKGAEERKRTRHDAC